MGGNTAPVLFLDFKVRRLVLGSGTGVHDFAVPLGSGWSLGLIRLKKLATNHSFIFGVIGLFFLVICVRVLDPAVV